jgi:hypothetical protein
MSQKERRILGEQIWYEEVSPQACQQQRENEERTPEIPFRSFHSILPKVINKVSIAL